MGKIVRYTRKLPEKELSLIKVSTVHILYMCFMDKQPFLCVQLG